MSAYAGKLTSHVLNLELVMEMYCWLLQCICASLHELSEQKKVTPANLTPSSKPLDKWVSKTLQPRDLLIPGPSWDLKVPLYRQLSTLHVVDAKKPMFMHHYNVPHRCWAKQGHDQKERCELRNGFRGLCPFRPPIDPTSTWFEASHHPATLCWCKG